MKEEVILVDEQDHATGTMEKMEAHRKGLLHRAFSVFIFNSENKLLLQQRAADKYHSALLWTNTCCSHPRPGETVLEAAARRLFEEMGLQADLTISFAITYRVDFKNGLTEHEYDYILVGKTDDVPLLNSSEAADSKYCSLDEIRAGVNAAPENYTEWFKMVYERVFASPLAPLPGAEGNSV